MTSRQNRPTVAVLDRVEEGRQTRTRRGRDEGTYCETPGCGRQTTFHKPFCVEHVERLP